MNTLICELASLWFLGIIFRLTVFYRYIQIEGRGLANVLFIYFLFVVLSHLQPRGSRLLVKSPRSVLCPMCCKGNLPVCATDFK